MNQLLLVRHTESAWNARDRFTGWRDVSLSERGERQARALGRLLAERIDGRLDMAVASALARARRTCALVLRALKDAPPMTVAGALNERDYGALTGVERSAARARWGAARVASWRRGYLDRPPGGESLADTRARAAPFYAARIAPLWSRGDARVLVVAHGNSLRALACELENLSPEEAARLDVAPGASWLYAIDADGAARERTLAPAPA